MRAPAARGGRGDGRANGRASVGTAARALGPALILALTLGLAGSGCGKAPAPKAPTPKPHQGVGAADAPPARAEAGAQDGGGTGRAGPGEGAAAKMQAKPRREPLDTTPPENLLAGFDGVPAGAHKTRSGVVWTTLRPGAGEASPKPDDRVTFHYVTWDPTGALKGDSQRKGAPKEMRVRKMLAGWREVLAGMRVGERRRAWLPAKLAHPRSRKRLGDRDRRVLDLELLALAAAPPAPKDVRRPPKGARRTPSGLVYEVLREGPQGGLSPGPTSRVTVRYAGWTTDGRCFDFTGPEETASFGVDGVIAGWTEGLQLMRVGDVVRFWIPAGLAYAGKPGKPKGMLVFDIELVATTEPK